MNVKNNFLIYRKLKINLLIKSILKLNILKYICFLAILLVAFLQILYTAWLTDDSAITLRTVLNFINGYGPVFNVGERVQAYTHPIWFLLISLLSLFLPNVYTATFTLSILISIFVFYFLFFKVARKNWIGLFTIALLLLSKSYIDFETSGLENPLSHLLLVVIFFKGLSFSNPQKNSDRNKNQISFFFFCALLVLNRQDLLLLILPVVFSALTASENSLKQSIKNFLIGFIPFILWIIFTFVYYGSFVPNTAYAKLNTGIPIYEKLTQGYFYIRDLEIYDPFTFILIIIGIFSGFKKNNYTRLFSIGICIYLAFIVNIGGDFMSGRFFTAPFIVAILILIQTNYFSNHKFLYILLLLISALNIQSTLLAPSKLIPKWHENGIADERSFFYNDHSLRAFKPQLLKIKEWNFKGISEVKVGCGLMGFSSINGGPGMHYIDACALADPLLSKIPPLYHHPYWRIGHYVRQLPTNYERSVRDSQNLLVDSRIKNYYDEILLITKGSLFSPQRLFAILRVNLGLVPLPDSDLYKFGFVPTDSRANIINLDEINNKNGIYTQANNFIYSAEIPLKESQSINKLSIAIAGDCVGEVEFLYSGFFVPFMNFKGTQDKLNDPILKQIEPSTMLTNRLRLVNTTNSPRCSLVFLKINH